MTRPNIRAMANAWSLAFLLPASIIAGYLIGWGLDRLFGTEPWLTWIFAALGVAAGFVRLFRVGMNPLR